MDRKLSTTAGALICPLGAIIFSTRRWHTDGRSTLLFTASPLAAPSTTVPLGKHCELTFGKRSYSAIVDEVQSLRDGIRIHGQLDCGQRLKVLLLEDHPADPGLFIEAFHEEDLAIEVTVHSNADVALIDLELTAGTLQRYGLLLIGRGIPQEAGRELLRHMRQRQHHGMHVAVMLPCMSDELLNRYRLLGVEHFVITPEDWHSYRELARLVREAVVNLGQPSPWGVLALGAEGETTTQL